MIRLWKPLPFTCPMNTMMWSFFMVVAIYRLAVDREQGRFDRLSDPCPDAHVPNRWPYTSRVACE
jgi:hypothetical protein